MECLATDTKVTIIHDLHFLRLLLGECVFYGALVTLTEDNMVDFGFHV